MKKLILLLAILFATQPLIASASLYSYYTELGQSLPSLSDRAVLYAEIGDDKYVGSAIQNNALEAYLRNLGGELGAVTPQPRLLGDNTWTGTNTFNGTTTLATTTITTLNLTNLNLTNLLYVINSSTTTSSPVKTSADTVKSKSNDITYTLAKNITIRNPGYIRVVFDVNGDDEPHTGYAKIYKNGVAYGTERGGAGSAYTTYYEDLFFSTGDVLELYYKTAGNGSPAYNVSVRNLRLYYTESSSTTADYIITN
jgi:hypothetical protein